MCERKSSLGLGRGVAVRNLGKRFAAAVERRLEVIAGDPERWPIEEQDVRAAKVPRWKFVIDYRVVSDIIVVIARFHTSRDPQDWKDRV